MRGVKWLFFGLLLLFGGMLFAAYLDSDYSEDSQRPTPVPPPIPRPLPPPVPPSPPAFRNEPAELVRLCTVGRPYHYRGFTIFPLSLRYEPDNRRYLTLDQALGRGSLRIQETGRVSELDVANLGQASVFLLAGEILVGGRQNRMVGQDIVIPPGTQVRVPVYCVEKGRWAGRDDAFASKSGLTLPGLRAAAGRGESQDRVWHEVARSSEAAKAPSRTEDFQAVYDADHVRKEIAGYHDAFRACWRQRLAGFVVCHGEQIVGAELFGNCDLFEGLRDKLLASYALDHICRTPPGDRGDRRDDHEEQPLRPPDFAASRAE